MRALHVIPSLAARDGGPARVALGMSRALQARGVETLIATTVSASDAVAVEPTGQATSMDGVPVVGFRRHDDAFKYSRGLSRWIRTHVEEFDVVHIHAVFSHSSLAAGRACRDSDVPYVLRPLGSLDPWALSRHRWRKRLLQPAVQILVNGASAVQFMTDEELRLATQNGAGRIGSSKIDSRSRLVIPAAVDDVYLHAASPTMAQREPIVAAIARLHPVKRLDALVRAFHAVAHEPSFSGWRLIIAGDSDAAYRVQLESVAASGSAGSRIQFDGWLDEHAKLALLARASLVAVPSFQENFGLGLVEAMAAGVPAIVSRGVNLSAAIERAGAGWVVPDDSESALADTLRTTMSDAPERQLRSLAARRLASQFTWASCAASLEALYASLRSAAVGARA